MKRILYGFFAIIAVALIAVGCTKTVNTSNNDLYSPKTVIYDVLKSEWYGLPFTNAAGKKGYSLEFKINEIDQYIADGGVVIVQMSTNERQSWQTLPATLDGKIYEIDQYLGGMTISMFSEGTTNAPIIDKDKYYFKFTMIDAKTLASKNIDKNNIQAVKAAFNIGD